MEQTNSLQKSYDPFANGRWYKIFLESNGTKVSIIESDIDGNIYSRYFTPIKNINFYTVLYDIHFINTTTQQTYDLGLNYITDSNIKTLRFSLPSPSSFDYAYIYVFGEKK